MRTAEEILKSIPEWNYGQYKTSDVIKAMKLYANQKLDEAALLSEEMIYQINKDEKSDGLIIRNFQTTYATPKQSILALKDEI